MSQYIFIKTIFLLLLFFGLVTNDETLPFCAYNSGTDLPVCSGCMSPSCGCNLMTVPFINFNVSNQNSTINHCGLTYFNPFNITMAPVTPITFEQLYTPGTINNLTEVWVNVFDGVNSLYNLMMGPKYVSLVYVVCSMGGYVSCNPSSSSFNVRGFEQLNSSMSIVGYHQSPYPNELCQCEILNTIPSYYGNDLQGNNCSFSNSTLNSILISHAPVCFPSPTQQLQKRMEINLSEPVKYYINDGVPILCELTSSLSTDYLLVNKENSLNSTIIISWNDNIINQLPFVGQIFSYSIPSVISYQGGTIEVLITYPDFTWSTCTVFLTSGDTCALYSDTEIPWSCMSVTWQALYVSFYIVLGIVILSGTFLIAYVMMFILVCVFDSINCIYQGRRTVAGHKVASFFDRFRGWTRPVAVASMAGEAYAMSDSSFFIAETSLTTIFTFMFGVGLIISLVCLIIKIIRTKRGKKALKEVRTKFTNIPSAVDLFSMKKPTPGVPLFLMMMICVCSCCNNNFLIQNTNTNCLQNAYGENCSISTSFQFNLNGLSSCMSLYSNSQNSPYGLEISLVNSGFYLELDTMYYTSMLGSYWQKAVNCDQPSNGNSILECETFNQIGSPSCSGINSDATGFPSSTGTVYSACNCELIQPDNNCGGLFLTEGKHWSYYVLRNTTYTFPVYKVQTIIPFYQISISIIDSHPTTSSCILTPFDTFCDVDGLQMQLTSSSTVPSFSSYYFFLYNNNYFYTSNANTVGSPNSCNIGNIQFSKSTSSVNNDNTGLWYNDFCNINALSNDQDYYSCCNNSISSYGYQIPYSIPGLGLVSYLNTSGFSGLVSQNGNLGSISISASINSNLIFSINSSKVCPVVSSIGYITGSYNSNTPASFSVDFKSSCLPGMVYVSCSTQILTTSFFITSSFETYIISFYSTISTPTLDCTVSGSTSSSFTVTTKAPLTEPMVNFNRTTGNGGLSQIYGDSLSLKNDWLNRNASSFGFASMIIASVVFILIVVLILVFLIVAYCGCKILLH